MLDDHFDEFNLGRRRDFLCQEFAESFANRRAVEPDNRANEAAETMARLAGALDITGFADAGIQQHLFEFAKVGWRERFTLPQLVENDVVFVRFEEMPGFLLEACEIRLADLRQLV